MKYKRFSLVLVLSAIVLSGKVTNGYADDNNEQAQRQHELHQLKKKIKSVRAELNRARSIQNRVLQELRTTEIEISQRSKSIDQLKRKRANQIRRLGQLQKQRNDLNNDLALQRNLLGQQLRTAYVIGKQEYLKLLLNQEDPNGIGRVFTYYKYFNQARSERIETSTKSLMQLAQIKKRIRKEHKALKALEQQQHSEKQKLEDGYKVRAIAIAKIAKKIQSKDALLQQMLTNEKRLERILKVIRENMTDILFGKDKRQAFAKLKGKLTWPALGKVKALFGKPRKIAKIKWNGVIIKAKQGNNVRAISHGRVAYADWLRGYGLLLIIDHGNGYMSLYGHNQSLNKETGDWVEAGDIIGSVGSSGGQRKAGLYFEIRHNGKPTNPKIWCRKVYRG
ncbi:peptidoglycan DD-metalloendopeptidase family protein [Beggiatoa alba]|nr:peptidoglycan DD-metalloendopeptidase family protein [Beggiatoa alba]